MSTEAQLAQAYEAGASASAHGRERASPLYAMGEQGLPQQQRWYAGYDAEERKRAEARRIRDDNKSARMQAGASKAGRRQAVRRA